jgi:hypothetical protein
MEKLKRGDKIYIDKDRKKESFVNGYLECRDGIVEVYEYADCSGYGAESRLFLCHDCKHEEISIIRHTMNNFTGEWFEERMTFDSDSFKFAKAIIAGNKDLSGGKYTLVRDF